MPEPLTARSLLFAPGDSPRKLVKAGASGADLVLLDLEDAVAEANKGEARHLVAEHLRTAARAQPQWVRINPLDSAHALADLAAIVPARPDGIMLPKATRAEAERLHHYLTALEAAAGLAPGGIRTIVVATETAPALFGLGDYAGCPRLAALTWGAEDSATALGATDNRDENGDYEFPYQLFRALCLAGAAAAGVTPIETIHGDFRDLTGLEKVAAKARRAGFRGMMAIHPDQVPVINRAFSPSEAEIAQAERIVAAFAASPGAGTIGLDGAMLDMPHLKRAQAVLAMVRG
ncbi:citrate lyase subunit beta/citryl-CoA lyase [Sphingomonas naasensis]|uniref:CoA ester lyase n=1 Tax=Sphingomonas naasensis TaxID=1344951 RepID=A0A4S1WSW5_9SPHN|nr:CoA ester lyase [Sphingomonas naasensis]NIJ19340.1 citrate lyase subunit beta/citryl-CoA lyase [Sphingomonas naasensis]TGX46509.1 CoA ester lyase [Sphingomonas naasensis]